MYRLCGLGSLTSDLAAAIARFEGSCPSPESCRNFNPGNLRAGPGQVGTDSRGFAIFPDYATGEAALERQVDLNIGRGLSLQEFFAGKPGVYPGYAPAADSNNPAGYASTVAGWLGIDPTVPLASVPGGDGSVSVDSWPTDAPGEFPGVRGAGLSPAAMVAVGIAGLGLLWAVTS